MLKDLQDRRRTVYLKAIQWEGIADTVSGEDGVYSAEIAQDIADASFEIRARADLYLATEQFEEFDAALAFLLSAAENSRRKIKDDAKATGLDFASALAQSRKTAEYLREIAKALTLLLKEAE